MLMTIVKSPIQWYRSDSQEGKYQPARGSTTPEEDGTPKVNPTASSDSRYFKDGDKVANAVISKRDASTTPLAV